MMNNTYHAGIDIGSTTIKVVILDSAKELVYSKYERHYADIKQKLQQVLHDIHSIFKNIEMTVMITLRRNGHC